MSRTKTHRPSLLRWGVFILLVLLAAPAFARSYHIQKFSDSIAIDAEGRAIITEEITFQFNGEFKGIHRYIPVEYPGPAGSNYTLFISDVEVTDGQGSPLKFERKFRSGELALTIYVPGANNASRTVRITYTALNAIRYFPDHDELYWNVTGNDWTVDIDSAEASVSLPSETAGSLRVQAFQGVYGSNDRADATITGSSARFVSTSALPPRGGLTLDIYVPRGILHEPSSITRAGWFLRSNLILMLPVVSLIVMGGLWYLKGRDPDPGLSVAPIYEAPDGMTPAEVGTLIDDTVDPRDITSTLIDLAVRGFLKIEEIKDKVLFFNSTDYVFHLQQMRPAWDKLARHEYEILDNMFAGDTAVCRFSDLKNSFYVAIPSIKKEILQELKDRSMYRVDPDTANGYRFLGVLLIAAPFVLLQITGKYQFFHGPLIIAVSVILSLIIVWLFGRNLTAKTMKGMRAYIGILGFQEFMSRVDGDRLRNFPPETFEKCLPYAIALGVEKHWATAFQNIVKDPPSWYVSPYPIDSWNALAFTNSMHTMSNSAYEAFTSAPRSSSSGSGFDGGGGGFSGGGFGGGGGDAF